MRLGLAVRACFSEIEPTRFVCSICIIKSGVNICTLSGGPYKHTNVSSCFELLFRNIRVRRWSEEKHKGSKEIWLQTIQTVATRTTSIYSCSKLNGEELHENSDLNVETFVPSEWTRGLKYRWTNSKIFAIIYLYSTRICLKYCTGYCANGKQVANTMYVIGIWVVGNTLGPWKRIIPWQPQRQLGFWVGDSSWIMFAKKATPTETLS